MGKEKKKNHNEKRRREKKKVGGGEDWSNFVMRPVSERNRPEKKSTASGFCYSHFELWHLQLPFFWRISTASEERKKKKHLINHFLFYVCLHSRLAVSPTIKKCHGRNVSLYVFIFVVVFFLIWNKERRKTPDLCAFKIETATWRNTSARCLAQTNQSSAAGSWFFWKKKAACNYVCSRMDRFLFKWRTIYLCLSKFFSKNILCLQTRWNQPLAAETQESDGYTITGCVRLIAGIYSGWIRYVVHMHICVMYRKKKN